MMDMYKTGLTSITFRKLNAQQVITLARDAGLDGIEWGGDVHVPPGDTENAARVAAMTREAGLTVLSYGSYYRAGTQGDFAPVLASARALGTDMIRIWPGGVASAAATEEQRAGVTAGIRAACAAALPAGVRIATEYHRNSLTDTPESALRLVREVDCVNFSTYWQPDPDIDAAGNEAALRAVIGQVSNIHVFHWVDGQRRALSEGMADWKRYLDAVHPAGRALIIEFVRNDDPAAFMEDAAALRALAGR